VVSRRNDLLPRNAVNRGDLLRKSAIAPARETRALPKDLRYRAARAKVRAPRT